MTEKDILSEVQVIQDEAEIRALKENMDRWDQEMFYAELVTRFQIKLQCLQGPDDHGQRCH